jgi:hypothetical protein
MHRFFADSAFLRLEANATIALQPALHAVRAVLMSARSGSLTLPDPYPALARTVYMDLKMFPALQYVQTAGTAAKTVFVRPDRMHQEEVTSLEQHTPLVELGVPISSCWQEEPFGCFNFTLPSFEIVSGVHDGVAFAWVGPEWLRKNQQGQTLGSSYWIYGVHLLATVNLSAPLNGLAASVPPFKNEFGVDKIGPVLAVDVALGLEGLRLAVLEAVPVGGAAYVCDSNGTLLAGSDWEELPKASPDIATGKVIYPTLWEVPWATAITPAMVRSFERSELWRDRDLVVVQPLFHSGVFPSMANIGGVNGTLRAVILTPRDTAVLPELGQLVFAAMAALAAPPIVVLLTILGCLFMATLRWCRCCGMGKKRISSIYEDEDAQ